MKNIDLLDHRALNEIRSGWAGRSPVLPALPTGQIDGGTEPPTGATALQTIAILRKFSLGSIAGQVRSQTTMSRHA